MQRSTPIMQALSKLGRTSQYAPCARLPRCTQRRQVSRSARCHSDFHTRPLSERTDLLTQHRLHAQHRAYHKRRMWYLGTGLITSIACSFLIVSTITLPVSKADSGADARKSDPMVSLGKERKAVVQKMGEEPEENTDTVPTGTSKVPLFPRLISFADSDKDKDVGVGALSDGGVEYQLVGLGIRTVSFLGIEVYVVGMYIATDDVASLQKCLIRKVDDVATTLVADEKTKLQKWLSDPEKGEQIWSDVLKESHARTIFRIVPTRDTDFAHMRDAWVRHLGNKARNDKAFQDESFGQTVAEFKALFKAGKSVPKGKEMVLARAKDGKLAVWYDDGKQGPQRLGGIADERVSRVLWLNYLAGKNVASEPARQNIVQGVMDFVERPVGTVATQVI